MGNFYRQHGSLIKRYLLIGVVACVVAGLAIPQEIAIYRAINGVFFGGILVFSCGAIGFASHLGGFDLFKYTHYKWGQYSKKNANNPLKTQLGTYYDYLSKKQDTKQNTGYFIPLCLGGLFIIIAILATFFTL